MCMIYKKALGLSHTARGTDAASTGVFVCLCVCVCVGGEGGEGLMKLPQGFCVCVCVCARGGGGGGTDEDSTGVCVYVCLCVCVRESDTGKLQNKVHTNLWKCVIHSTVCI
jgi:hypothetical protein